MDKFNNVLFLTAITDYTAPVAENVQLEPHSPWSPTGVMTFFPLQFTYAGGVPFNTKG